MTEPLSQARPIPPLGVHDGVPMEEYHRWDAASNSRLSRLRRSPAHLRAYLAGAEESTDALRLGKASHCAILEPDEFTSRYVCAPEGIDRRTKEGKAAWANLQLEYGPEGVLKAEEYAMCLGVRDSLHRMTRARALLTGPGSVEQSVVWNDSVSGVRCKMRMDRYRAEVDGGIIADLKSTMDASERAFALSIMKHGYHRQGALYLEGAAAVDIPAQHFVIIAYEKEPPYAVAVYRLTEGALDAGAQQNAKALARYRECVEKNEWPAYPDEIRDITLPDWAWSVVDEELEGAAS